MRIAIVLDSLSSGGTERSTVEMLPSLVDADIDVAVVVLRRAVEGFEPEVSAAGAVLHVLREDSMAGRVRALREFLGAWRPDVVHTALFAADLVGRVAAVGNSPVLTSLVNDTYGPGRRADMRVPRWKLEATRIVDALGARLLTAHFHAVSSSVKTAAVRDLRIPRRRITVVPRSRDAQRIRPSTDEERASARARLGLADATRVVLAVGRQEYQKGHRHLIEALSRMGALHPPLLLIAGREGAETADLRRLAACAGLADSVQLLGHRHDIGDLLAAADVFAFPSLYEGCAGALLEACMAGVPVVASDLAPVREVVSDRPGTVLVPPASSNAIAAALDTLFANVDYARASCTAAATAYAREAAPETVNRQMIQLYCDVADAVPAERSAARRPSDEKRDGACASS